MAKNKPASRTYVFVCLAGLSAGLLSACAELAARLDGSPSETTARHHVERAKRLFEEGNYDAALKDNEAALSLAAGKPPGDQALFNMGLIAAHSKNPARDYPKALELFERLVREYPQSALLDQAKVWVEVLQEHERIAREKKLLVQEKQALTQEKLALAREREKLNRSIEQSRKVDIEIEERRRKAPGKNTKITSP
ncbi:MAG TPA: hypothetical protein VNL14_19425 [Candidatus Acidoferrales bacterium]|nr:hypothetical protein [Candidatus Acidoferrales bacterium]